MTHRRLALAALGLAAASVAGGLAFAQPAPAAPAAGPAGPTKVGVVSVKQVIRKSKELMDIQTGLGEAQKGLAARHAGHADSIKDMQEKLRQMQPGSAAFTDGIHKLQATALQYEMEEKLRQIEIARDQSEGLKRLFTELQAAVADVAKRRGLDIVIVDIDPDLPTAGQEPTYEQLQNLYGQKNVLFKAPGVTLDDDVTTTLDTMFSQGKGGAAAPAPAPTGR